MTQHHLFVSYARKDNGPNGNGWVTSLVARLKAQHFAYAQRELKPTPFFDAIDIKDGQDWWGKISDALKSSKLFMACLSPNYLESDICRLEWETWLQFEHNQARGNDGVKMIYFAEIPGLFGKDLTIFRENARDWVADLQRRNLSAPFDLKPWFPLGPQVLAEIDAGERLAALRQAPENDSRQLIKLADMLGRMDIAIAQRLDEITLAEIASNERGKIHVPYRTFVGRHAELLQLHNALKQGGRGLVGALHGLGGLGKTALAVQYAHAYAGHYAAGGTWIIGCEGISSLAAVFAKLASDMKVELPKQTENQSYAEWQDSVVRTMLAAMRARVAEGATLVAERLGLSGPHSRPEHRPKVARRILLVLDNVDQPELFTAASTRALSGEDWLEIVVTTRLDTSAFMLAQGGFAPIAIEALPVRDGLALLRQFRAIQTQEDEAAASEIVHYLDGFTLLLELTGAWLKANETVTLRAYANRLSRDGLGYVERDEAKLRPRLRYGEDGRAALLSAIVTDTMEQISEEAVEVLRCAALMPADEIVESWLRSIVAARYPNLAESAVEEGDSDPWVALLSDLMGRRLLTASRLDSPDPSLRLLSMHRMVGEAVRLRASEECQFGEPSRLERIEGLIKTLVSASEQQQVDRPYSLQPKLGHILSLTLVQKHHSSSEAIAKSLLDIGTSLFSLGRREDALLAEFESAAIYRILAKSDSLHIEASLAICLQNLSTTLTELGRAEEGIIQANNAVDIARGLVLRSPISYSHILESSLSTLSNALSDAGKIPEGLLAAEEAVERSMFWAKHGEEDEKRRFANQLINLGNRYSQVGRLEEAQASVSDGVQLLKEIARLDEESHRANLARGLINLGITLTSSGKLDEALAVTQESLAHFEALFKRNETAFAPELAKTTMNVAGILSNLSRPNEAEAWGQDAVRQYRALVKDNSQAFAPDLAKSLNNLSVALSSLKQWEAARSAAQEAVDLYQPYFATNPEAFASEIATCYNTLGNASLCLDYVDSAQKALLRALQLRRDLFANNPRAFCLELGMSCGLLGRTLRVRGMDSEAVEVLDEGIQAILPFATVVPANVYIPLALSLAADRSASQNSIDLAKSIPSPKFQSDDREWSKGFNFNILGTSKTSDDNTSSVGDWRDISPTILTMCFALGMSPSKLEALLDRCWRVAKEDPTQFIPAVKRALAMDRAPQAGIDAIARILEARQ